MGHAVLNAAMVIPSRNIDAVHFGSSSGAISSASTGIRLPAHQHSRPPAIVLDLGDKAFWLAAAATSGWIDLDAPLKRPALSVEAPPDWLASLDGLPIRLFRMLRRCRGPPKGGRIYSSFDFT